MLVVRVEVWPGGDRRRAQEIARVGVANTSGLRATSNYSVVSLGADGKRTSGRVLRHRRASGWLPLVARALAALSDPVDAVTDGEAMTTILGEAS